MTELPAIGQRFYTPAAAPQQCVDPALVPGETFFGPQQDFTPAAPPVIAPPNLAVLPGGQQAPAVRFEDLAYSDLAAGRSSSWVTFNLSGLKHVNDHYVGGHNPAGDAYLEAAKSKLSQISIELFGTDLIISNGPNLAIHAPENYNMSAFFDRVNAEFKNGIEFSYEYKGETIHASYTPATEGRPTIYNIGELKFSALRAADGTVLITREGIYRALREEIYMLNRRGSEIVTGRHNSTYVVTSDQAALLNSYSLQNRLLDFNPRVEAPAGAAIEPTSRLANGAQMQADAIRLLSSGKSAHFAFLDVNMMSSFRSLGFQGELMMDAIVEERMAQAARVLPDGVTIYRANSGSEEFYLVGDSDKVTAAQMREASQNFMRALNETPFRLLVDREAFARTTLGGQYLREHPELETQKLKLSNGKSIDVVPVDVTDVVRQSASGLRSRGITVTLGEGTITPAMVAERTARGPQSAAAVTFEQVSKAITELGEVAKDLNPLRRNLQLEVDFVDGKPVGRIIPLDSALSDPRPVSGDAHASVIDEAVRNNYTIEFTTQDRKIRTVCVRDEAGNVVPEATRRAADIFQGRAQLTPLSSAPVSATEQTSSSAGTETEVLQSREPGFFDEPVSEPPIEQAGRNLGEVLAGEKGKVWFRAFLQRPEGKAFIRDWAKSGALNAGSFLFSLLAAAGAETLMKDLGITDFKYTFPTSMGAGMGADLAFRKAFVKGFQVGSVGSLAKGLGAGLAFSFLGSSLYNGSLDAAGAGPGSFWRGTVPEMGVSLGFGLGGAALLEPGANIGTAYLAGNGVMTGSSMGAAGAALPFAIFAAGNELLPRILNSQMELEVKQQVQDDIRTGLAREGGVLNNYALFMSCVPIFSNLITFVVPDGMVAEKSWEWVEQNALPARSDMQSRLASIWMQADGQAMGLDYRGEARDISFYQNASFSYERIAQLMQTRIEFSDHYTKYNEVAGRYGEYYTQSTEVSYPPDDIHTREAHAYEYLTQATKGLNSEQYAAKMPGILQKVQADYHIENMGDFLLRVQIKAVQDEARFLAGTQVEEAERLSGGGGTTFHVERGMFNRDGTLKAGMAQQMVAFANSGRLDEVGKGIVEQRKYLRTVALAQGAQATPVDVTLGLANANGSVNESSVYYQNYLKNVGNFLAKLAA